MKHLVIFKFKEEYVNDELFTYATQVFQELKEALPEDIYEVTIHRNIIQRSFNGDLMIDMDVKDENSLQTYLTHPIHVALTQIWMPNLEGRMSFDYDK